MLINLKNNLHWFLYGAGLCVYFIMLTQTTLTLSIIWLLFVLYAWLLVLILTNQYCFKSFLYVFCFSGIIVSLSLFFSYGVEQIPLPVGAILFKEEGILPSLLLFFVFSIPLLVYNRNDLYWNKEVQPLIKNKKKTDRGNATDHMIVSEEWEEATINDLESGSYEPA